MPIPQPAQNPMNAGQPPAALAYAPLPSGTANPLGTNPTYTAGPTWTYVQVAAGPRWGPQPRLAQGTGPTGAHSRPGQAPQLPGFVSENDYQPNVYQYQPANRQDFTLPIPRSIGFGVDGNELVGTYRAHDFTGADRFFHQGRQAANWQVIAFPPAPRNLLQWQQAQRYRVVSMTSSARVLDQSQYFLGYQTTPQVQAQIGQTGLGYMGSF